MYCKQGFNAGYREQSLPVLASINSTRDIICLDEPVCVGPDVWDPADEVSLEQVREEEGISNPITNVDIGRITALAQTLNECC